MTLTQQIGRNAGPRDPGERDLADRILISFDGLPRPVLLLESGDVYNCFSSVFHDWPFRLTEAGGDSPILTVRRTPACYLIEAAWLDAPLRRKDHIDALCGFIAELIRAFAENGPDLLCLHGAAAEFAGRLVIFPNRYRAGKSVLSACLAAAGVRLFADDVLPIGGPEDRGLAPGIAPGIAPRLRLPWPDDLSPAAKAFLETHQGPRGRNYLYLDLERARLAPHGAAAPIGGFVLLEREADAEPELLPVAESEMLRQVIWQNFARETPAPDILERLHRLVAGARCFRLRYGRAEQAVALLREAFAEWPAPGSDEPRSMESPLAPNGIGGRTPTWTGETPDGCYLRKPGITETTVDGERFLADAEGAAIHHLNPVASAVWHLLAEPMTRDQLVELLHSAFPEVARDQIARDVGVLIRDLPAKQLLLSV
jgi:hypothetical protein